MKLFDHIKISSKDGSGVKKAFEMIFRRILQINEVPLPPEEDDASVENTPASDPIESSPTPAPALFTPTPVTP
ncbi:MAG: hypothetical protein E4G98_01575, partial [Promethearchaeota archaeon]